MTAVLDLPGATVADNPDTHVCAAGGRPHPVTDSGGRPVTGWLCDRHLHALGVILRGIEREAASYQYLDSGKLLGNLNPVPSMQIRWDRSGGGLASQQTPARLDAIVHRDPRRGTGMTPQAIDDEAAWDSSASTLETLHSWAEQVRRERPLTRPTATVRLGWLYNRRGPICGWHCGHDTCGMWITDTIRAEPTIRSERDLLTRHLDWIAGQDWAGDLYKDLARLLDQLRRTNGTHLADPLPGRCPSLIDNRECGGPLWPGKPEHTVGEWTGSATSAVACGACKTRWEGPSALARLALILDTQGRRSA